MKTHNYVSKLRWTGNTGRGTADYRAYSRDHLISVGDKPEISGSSDPAFRGDPGRYSPEDMFLASVSSCHMLWYLHLCATAGIVVTAYEDKAEGTMTEDADGGGRFTSITLKPIVTITDELLKDKALQLHQEANRLCFIANSCNFNIGHEPVVNVG